MSDGPVTEDGKATATDEASEAARTQHARDMRDAVVAVIMEARWRTGQKVGRTIYAQFTADPLDSDPLIGVMDYPELADAVVETHNAFRVPDGRQARG